MELMNEEDRNAMADRLREWVEFEQGEGEGEGEGEDGKSEENPEGSSPEGSR